MLSERMPAACRSGRKAIGTDSGWGTWTLMAGFGAASEGAVGGSGVAEDEGAPSVDDGAWREEGAAPAVAAVDRKLGGRARLAGPAGQLREEGGRPRGGR